MAKSIYLELKYIYTKTSRYFIYIQS